MSNFECLFIYRSNNEPFLLYCDTSEFAHKVACTSEIHISNVFYDSSIVFHVSPTKKCGYLFDSNLKDLRPDDRILFVNNCKLYCFMHGLSLFVRNEWGS